MKNIFCAFILFCFAQTAMTQSLNWEAIPEESRHLTALSIGYDFGLTTQLTYGYQIKKDKPIFATIDFSKPAGADFLDDFKVRIGAQVQLYQVNNFKVIAKGYGLYRQHKTDFVSMASFGSDFSLTAGLYQKKWHIAAELGFDKAIATKLKNGEILTKNYSEITDGWYVPTAGNFYYGLEGSKSLGQAFDLSFRIGATRAEGKDEGALLPVYAQFGLIWVW